MTQDLVLTVPFVGRTLEQEKIETHLRKKGALLFVHGQPGIGKSRLWEECLSNDQISDIITLDFEACVDAKSAEQLIQLSLVTLGALPYAAGSAIANLTGPNGLCIALDHFVEHEDWLLPWVAEWRAQSPETTWILFSRNPAPKGVLQEGDSAWELPSLSDDEAKELRDYGEKQRNRRISRNQSAEVNSSTPNSFTANILEADLSKNPAWILQTIWGGKPTSTGTLEALLQIAAEDLSPEAKELLQFLVQTEVGLPLEVLRYARSQGFEAGEGDELRQTSLVRTDSRGRLRATAGASAWIRKRDGRSVPPSSGSTFGSTFGAQEPSEWIAFTLDYLARSLAPLRRLGTLPHCNRTDALIHAQLDLGLRIASLALHRHDWPSLAKSTLRVLGICRAALDRRGDEKQLQGFFEQALQRLPSSAEFKNLRTIATVELALTLNASAPSELVETIATIEIDHTADLSDLAEETLLYGRMKLSSETRSVKTLGPNAAAWAAYAEAHGLLQNAALALCVLAAQDPLASDAQNEAVDKKVRELLRATGESEQDFLNYQVLVFERAVRRREFAQAIDYLAKAIRTAGDHGAERLKLFLEVFQLFLHRVLNKGDARYPYDEVVRLERNCERMNLKFGLFLLACSRIIQFAMRAEYSRALGQANTARLLAESIDHPEYVGWLRFVETYLGALVRYDGQPSEASRAMKESDSLSIEKITAQIDAQAALQKADSASQWNDTLDTWTQDAKPLDYAPLTMLVALFQAREREQARGTQEGTVHRERLGLSSEGKLLTLPDGNLIELPQQVAWLANLLSKTLTGESLGFSWSSIAEAAWPDEPFAAKEDLRNRVNVLMHKARNLGFGKSIEYTKHGYRLSAELVRVESK